MHLRRDRNSGPSVLNSVLPNSGGRLWLRRILSSCTLLASRPVEASFIVFKPRHIAIFGVSVNPAPVILLLVLTAASKPWSPSSERRPAPTLSHPCAHSIASELRFYWIQAHQRWWQCSGTRSGLHRCAGSASRPRRRPTARQSSQPRACTLPGPRRTALLAHSKHYFHPVTSCCFAIYHIIYLFILY